MPSKTDQNISFQAVKVGQSVSPPQGISKSVRESIWKQKLQMPLNTKVKALKLQSVQGSID